jgi:hypothetical protein
MVQRCADAPAGIAFDKPVRYQLDGGARKKVTKLRITVCPSSPTVCVQPPEGSTRQRRPTGP